MAAGGVALAGSNAGCGKAVHTADAGADWCGSAQRDCCCATPRSAQTIGLMDACQEAGVVCSAEPCDAGSANCESIEQCVASPGFCCCQQLAGFIESNASLERACMMIIPGPPCNADPDPCCMGCSGPQDPSGCQSLMQCEAHPTPECCTEWASQPVESPGETIHEVCAPVLDAGSATDAGPDCGANPDPCCLDAGSAACKSVEQCMASPGYCCCQQLGGFDESNTPLDQACMSVPPEPPCNADPDPCCVACNGEQDPTGCHNLMQCEAQPTVACCSMWVAQFLPGESINQVCAPVLDAGPAVDGGADAAPDGAKDAAPGGG